MAKPQRATDAMRDFTPKLVELTEGVLFGDVWERPELSKRDRSLIVISALIALGKERQMVGHLNRALETACRSTRSRKRSPISPSTAAGRPP